MQHLGRMSYPSVAKQITVGMVPLSVRSRWQRYWTNAVLGIAGVQFGQGFRVDVSPKRRIKSIDHIAETDRQAEIDDLRGREMPL